MPPARRNLLLCLILLAVTAGTMGPVCRGEFLWWDDQDTLAGNPDFNPPTSAGIKKYWTEPGGDLYIPATYTAWGILAMAAYPSDAVPLPPRPVGLGPPRTLLDPFVFHLANLLLHMMTVLAVFALLRLLTGDAVAAMLGAMFFAVNPLQVESVAWASGLKDVLCGFFSIVALWQYAIFVKCESRRRLHYALATAAFALALLSKPAAVALPLAAAAIELTLRRGTKDRFKSALARLWPWLAASFVIALVARNVHGQSPASWPIWARPLAAADALAFYLYKLVVPIPMGVDYGRSPDLLIRHGLIFFIWIVPVAAGIAVICWRRRPPLLTLAAALFLIPLLPVLGLIPFEYQYYSTTADHYLYVALLGPALLVSWALSRRPDKSARILAAAWIACLAMLSFRQTHFWHDTQRLMAHSLSVNPQSVAANFTLGLLAAAEGRLDAAQDYYQTALETRPDDPKTQFNLGNLLAFQKHDPAAAIEHYQIALKSWSGNQDPHLNLGHALLARNAPGDLQRANHEFAVADVIVGQALIEHHMLKEAAIYLQRACGEDPNYAPARAALDQLKQ